VNSNDGAFDMNELQSAAALVHGIMPATPQYAWPKLKVRAGCTVWVKHENHTPTGAFKFAARRPVKADSAKTFADGLATREPNADAVARMCGGAERMVEVDEDEIAEAMRIYFDDTHQVAEGAGAAPLAALMQERGRMAGKNVAVVLSGGNIERARFLQVQNGITPSVA
jgi:threonine dehydratase